MESGFTASNQPGSLLVGPFGEEETSAILELIRKTISSKVEKAESVPKTIFIDFFGTQKSMKTTVTGKIEQVFRRHKFQAYCPPETAEIEEVRNFSTKSPVVEQLKHLTGVQYNFLNLAYHPRCHLAITSRGLIDMLYWYERGLRKGDFGASHVERIRNFVYELLKLDLVDAFFFFTCSVETAMRREYEGSLTQRRGSKMNEKDVAETINIYNSVLKGVRENVSEIEIPIVHVDTSDMGVREAGEEVIRHLLPTICARFNVPIQNILPHFPSLIRKHIARLPNFEEQVKFVGHPDESKICNYGWDFVAEYWQEDIYLNPRGAEEAVDSFGEVMRIRRDENGFKFMYKGVQKDSLLSHRFPCSFQVDDAEVKKIQETYKTVLTLRKKRRCFEMTGRRFTLHLDEIEGLGKFTEFRTQGSAMATNTEALLKLAGNLGFSLDSMVEGNYLSLALAKQTP